MASRMTVVVMTPGRRSLSFGLPGWWPAALAMWMLMPVVLGAAAQRCYAIWRGHDAAMPSASQLMRPASAQPASERPASPSRSPIDTKKRKHEDGPTSRQADWLPELEQRTAAEREMRASTRWPAVVAMHASLEAIPVLSTTVTRQPVGQAPVVNARAVIRAFKKRRLVTTIDEERAAELAKGTLRLHVLHSGERLKVRPFDDRGQPDPVVFSAINHAMRCRVTNQEVAIDRRLVQLLVQISTAYDSTIHVISGYRAPHANGTSTTSQHVLGRAADIRVSGETSMGLGNSARQLGARGVGLYRNQHFVHLDVRDRAKYFWVASEEENFAADSMPSEPSEGTAAKAADAEPMLTAAAGTRRSDDT